MYAEKCRVGMTVMGVIDHQYVEGEVKALAFRLRDNGMEPSAYLGPAYGPFTLSDPPTRSQIDGWYPVEELYEFKDYVLLPSGSMMEKLNVR